MEGFNKIDAWVTELLGLHSCVTIPGLGSFIYRDSPASSNTFTFEIKPSSRTVFFNNALVADDGILTNKVRENLGLDYPQALNWIGSWVIELRNRLKDSRTIEFGSLGNFFLNSEKEVFFLPAPHLNLSQSTYGLPIIRLSELEKSKASEFSFETNATLKTTSTVSQESDKTKEFEEANVVLIDEDESRRNLSWIWKAAAVLAITFLGASGVYFGSLYFKKSATSQEANLNLPQENKADPGLSADEMVPTETDDTKNVSVEPNIKEADKAVVKSQEEVLDDLKSAKGKYFVLGGMYMDESLAKLEVATWNSNGVSCAVFKAKNSSLYKVVLNRFENEKDASVFTEQIPVYSGAHVSVRETELFK